MIEHFERDEVNMCGEMNVEEKVCLMIEKGSHRYTIVPAPIGIEPIISDNPLNYDVRGYASDDPGMVLRILDKLLNS